MGILLGLVAIVLLVILLGRISSLQQEMRALRQHLEDRTRIEQRLQAPPVAHVERPAVVPPPEAVPPSVTPARPAPSPAPVVPDLPVAVPEVIATTPPVTPTGPALPISPSPVRNLGEEVREAVASRPRATPVVPMPPPAPPRPSFLKRNPDLEKFIGENLINKIGIAILVIGLGLLVKFANGQGYLSKTALTIIGVASGGLLLFFAHRLREKFRAFSSVLVGGGLAVLYFSIYIAFQQYHIIGQTAAFFVMVGISGLGVLLTLVYDRKELAVIALLGGFLAPFLSATGEGNYKVLFTYLLILNGGMLVLANYKKWHIINIISFVLTLAIFGGWLALRYPDLDPAPVWPVLLFATGFFLVFFGMNLSYNLRHGEAFGPLDFSLLLANSAAYYAVGMVVLNDLPFRIHGLFTLALALFHLVFAILLYKRANTSRHLVFLLIGLVLTFVSLAAPVQLHGNHITLFWSAECVLLLWFSQRTHIKLVERASMLVMALMLISLFMDFGHHYGADPLVHLTPLLNKPWITGMASAVALGLYARLLSQFAPGYLVVDGIERISATVLRQVVLTLMTIVLFFTNFLELGHQLGYLVPHHLVVMALGTYSLGAMVLIYFLTRSAPVITRWGVLALLAAGLLFQITGFYGHSLRATLDLRIGAANAWVLPFHLAGVVVAVFALVCVAQLVRTLLTRGGLEWTVYLWVMCTVLVIFCSQELDHVILAFIQPTDLHTSSDPVIAASGDRYAFMHALRSMRKGAYPILWGLGSFVFMWYGMRTRQRMVRIIALSLFAVTLLKMFVVDIWSMTQGGKVAAFICLGILLMVVSFMYNKLKGLLLTNDAETPPAEQPGTEP